VSCGKSDEGEIFAGRVSGGRGVDNTAEVILVSRRRLQVWRKEKDFEEGPDRGSDDRVVRLGRPRVGARKEKETPGVSAPSIPSATTSALDEQCEEN